MEGKFDREQKLQYILEAGRCGREEAALLKEEHNTKDPDVIASKLGLKVFTPDTPSGGGHGVSASEISAAETALISEGLPVEEVQKLCDVHAAVFKGSIEEIHHPSDPTLIPGHPLNVLVKENEKIAQIVEDEIRPYLPLTRMSGKEAFSKVKEGVNQLKDLSVHYGKKENLLFPYMEKYGITAPPKVMLIQQFGLLNLLVPSQLADEKMGYGMLFVIGLVTSVHCVAMIRTRLPSKRSNLRLKIRAMMSLNKK